MKWLWCIEIFNEKKNDQALYPKTERKKKNYHNIKIYRMFPASQPDFFYHFHNVLHVAQSKPNIASAKSLLALPDQHR
jgi:hypothetical protein